VFFSKVRSRLSSFIHSTAFGKICETLMSNWWAQHDICEMSDTLDSNKCQISTELLLPNINGGFIQRQTKRFVDSDCPG
jgi:hypothetical protein